MSGANLGSLLYGDVSVKSIKLNSFTDANSHSLFNIVDFLLMTTGQGNQYLVRIHLPGTDNCSF